MYEIAFVVMSSYMAYLVSEAMELSGIVSLFFTGMCGCMHINTITIVFPFTPLPTHLHRYMSRTLHLLQHLP